MQFVRPSSGARALRLLSLSSVVILAACGGGSDQPSTVLSTEITADTQLQVAADAGNVVSTLNGGNIFAFFNLIPDFGQQNRMLLSRVATTLLRSATPTALLAAAARKFAPVAVRAWLWPRP